jgi:hypothetical protein
MAKKKLKKLAKAAVAAGTAYGLSKMMGPKADAMKYMGGNQTGDASIAENISIFDRGMDKIAEAGGVSKLKAGSKNTVMARGCKLGKNKRTIIT